MEVFVGHKLVDRCFKFGTKQYKSSSRHNRNFTKTRTSLTKRVAMARAARVAECAVCLFMDQDPAKELDWQTKRSDAGFDMKSMGLTIDVKATDHPGASRLMWPIKAVSKLPTAADVFVFAKVLEKENTEMGQVVHLCGWVSRERFIKEHRKSYGLRGIIDGTPYMDEKNLDRLDTLKQHVQASCMHQNNNQK